MSKPTPLSLHDIYGTPFKIKADQLMLEASPPNILYFENLFRLYNLRAMEIEPRLKAGDTLDARIQVIATVTQMLHVALHQARPDDLWTLERTANLVQQNPEVLDQYLEQFRAFMPQKAPAKKSRTSIPN